MPSETHPAVLVVDDEPDLLEAMTGLLAPAYDVRTAASAEQALERLRTDIAKMQQYGLKSPEGARSAARRAGSSLR